MIACPKCDKGKASRRDYAPKEVTGYTSYKSGKTQAEVECKGCGGILWASSSWILSRACAIRDERRRSEALEIVFRATGDERVRALLRALHRVSDHAKPRSGNADGMIVPGDDWRALMVACRAFVHTNADSNKTCPGCGLIFATSERFGEHVRTGCRFGIQSDEGAL